MSTSNLPGPAGATSDEELLRNVTIEAQLGTIKQLRGELRVAEEGLANYAQEVHRLSLRCAALACLLYPNPDAVPREAVAGDIDG